uniref:Si:dkey-245n4.2 n=1 Tax=Paramormyrops kingsleyae TaxID=1676925 RepID=A0A3B3SIG5_9TELE|nr:uncharacterized protein LOC111847264 [Paramormyrops kingsleyae]XP_023674060.1 uncharacterized protein LOC111847264 [Paramormyrops kingsleyae]
MERRWRHLFLTVFVFHETLGFGIRNEHLGKCLQLQVSWSRGVTLKECSPGSALQEWHWDPETLVLRSLQTGECLSTSEAPGHVSIHLKNCGTNSEEREGQVWTCSKKGHLTLQRSRLHLSAQHDKVFLTKERGKGSKWRTMSNRTICSEHQWNGHDIRVTQKILPFEFSSSTSSINTFLQQNSVEDGLAFPKPTKMDLDHISHSPRNSGPEDSSRPFLSQEYGLTWKVTMLVLSSLALVLGVIILLLNIHYNRKRKILCVLRSVTPNETGPQQGSPVPNERAPLTQHPMRPGHSSSLQRGEILIEWKDGSITPLFENSTYMTE